MPSPSACLVFPEFPVGDDQIHAQFVQRTVLAFQILAMKVFENLPAECSGQTIVVTQFAQVDGVRRPNRQQHQ